MKKIIGIDLGTTYSCVSFVNDYGQTEIVMNSDNERTMPSVVWFDGERAVVGKEAKEMSSTSPNAVCSFVKRNIGNDDFTFEVDGVQYTPEHVSSLILRKLVQDASEYTGEKVTDVVITCPAYFFIKERDATKRAGEMAGLNVLQIVNEPTAAAVAYGVKPGESSTKDTVVLVYDLGGGTFDITLIHVSENGLDVICTDGDHQLGGKDWDDCLVRHIARRFTDETGITLDLENKPEIYAELMQRAEQIKKQLTEKRSSQVKFFHEGETVQFDLSREDFERITEDLVEKTLVLTHQCLTVAKEQKGFPTFDKLVLVGGSSRMPMIINRLKQEFGMEPQLFEPDEAVAKGAAIIGNNIRLRKMIEEKLQSKNPSRDLTLDTATPTQISQAMQETAAETGYTLEVIQRAKKRVRNVTSKSFGSECIVGLTNNGEPIFAVINLIARNTPLPASKSENFSTMSDNQLAVRVAVAQNMEDFPNKNGENPPIPLDMCTLLWEGMLEMLPGLPRGSLTTDTYLIDENGLLTITTEDPASGNRLVQRIETGYSSINESAQTTKRCRELTVE